MSRPALGVVLIAPVISKRNQICFQALYGLGVCHAIKKLCVLLKSDILT